MLKLETVSGLPLKLDGVRLVFEEGLPEVEPDVRHLQDFKDVLAPDSPLQGPADAYFMYRDIGWPKDKEMFRQRNYRYDITVVQPGVVGRELVKTVGHYHPLVPETDVTYPEVYEVISGRAHYVCQKVDGNKVLDFFVVEALPGQDVVIPPGYGHITINPEDEPLVMSNVTADGFKSIYKPLEEKHGAAYYELEDFSWEKNDNYDMQAEPKWARANEVPEFALTEAVPLYVAITENPDKFDFLLNPQNYLDTFDKALRMTGGLLG
ncbi:MAG TPA: glucose-6-phosphate isomerase family protein [Anaerolineae bacterium]|nr:glucose-6-phosphate isomerase family protein [Anaerolineae bacterium]